MRDNGHPTLAQEVESDEQRIRYESILGQQVTRFLKFEAPFDVTYGSVVREFRRVERRPNVADLRRLFREDTAEVYGADHPNA